jgi:hypothetical protein
MRSSSSVRDFTPTQFAYSSLPASIRGFVVIYTELVNLVTEFRQLFMLVLVCGKCRRVGELPAPRISNSKRACTESVFNPNFALLSSYWISRFDLDPKNGMGNKATYLITGGARRGTGRKRNSTRMIARGNRESAVQRQSTVSVIHRKVLCLALQRTMEKGSRAERGARGWECALLVIGYLLVAFHISRRQCGLLSLLLSLPSSHSHNESLPLQLNHQG